VTEFPSRTESETEDSGPNTVVVKAQKGFTGWANVGLGHDCVLTLLIYERSLPIPALILDAAYPF
jgi:hypothetical protein